MLILGHVGVGLGLVQLCEAASRKVFNHRANVISSLIDYRFFSIGALLPDLIDKPLAWLILPGTLHTTRSIGHTLALLAALLIITISSRRFARKRIVSSLAFGTFSHLVFDGMWNTPQTLLWPILGWAFPQRLHRSVDDYWATVWDNLWQFPWLGPTEIFGAVVIAELLYRLSRSHRMKRFLTHGTMTLDVVASDNSSVVDKIPGG